MREVNAAMEEMRRGYDPLASHIFVARRQYHNMSDTKSGKRHERAARLAPRAPAGGTVQATRVDSAIAGREEARTQRGDKFSA